MVRKWSYLGNYEYNLSSDFKYLKAVFKFKVFKKTTRFKKAEITSITYMFRKKYSKRKHKTNWISMTYITFEWSHFFIRGKQFIRFYQNLGLFNYQVFSPSSWYINNQSVEGLVLNPINTFSCSKKIINKFSSNSNNTNYLSSPFTENRSVGCSVVEHPKDPVFDIPGILVSDNLMYEQSIEFFGNSSYEILYSSLNETFYKKTVSYVTCFYSLTILLTMHMSLNKKIYYVSKGF